MGLLLFIKGFWKPILSVLFFSIVLSYIGIHSCRENKATRNSEIANTAILRAHIVDSMQTLNLKDDISKIKKARAIEALKTDSVSKVAGYWKSVALKKEMSYSILKRKADSLAKLDFGQCAEIIRAFNVSIDTLRSENNALNMENEALDHEAKGYSRQLYLCNLQCTKNDSVIISNEKYIRVLQQNIGNLQCYRDWGNGHPVIKWLFGWKCKK